MCGIAGFIDLKHELGMDACEHVATDMANTLKHRGPDAGGVWIDEKYGVALAHRRLSIIDPSEAGAQPMHAQNGRFVLVQNGEIYNYKIIKKELEEAGITLPGHSDTKVALAAIEKWGLEAALKRLVGQFAFVLWDKLDATITLVRDRMGEKPLYVGYVGNSIIFASELKAFKMHPHWTGDLDRNAIALFMRHNAIPAPWSVYQGIRKIRPGQMMHISSHKHIDGELIFSAPGTNHDWVAVEKPYWSVDQAAGSRKLFELSESEDCVDQLESLIKQSVGGQMISDVPLGAFLSGGVDSSTITAVMQSTSPKPIKTFSIGFAENEYNEAPYAKQVAKHLGTDHTELIVTPREAMDVIADLPVLYDEPFADSSQIPTLLVSGLASKEVTVSLSGDGGDELFAGYDRYYWAQKISNSTGFLPASVRKLLSGIVKRLSVSTWDNISKPLCSLIKQTNPDQHLGHKLHRLASILEKDNHIDIYHDLISHWTDLDSLVLGSHSYPTIFNNLPSNIGNLESIEQYMLLDMLTYLPDDILVKVDRASMGRSLEARAPFLDHRIVEFSWRIPLSIKQRDGQSKWPLREVLRRYVPDELIDRPKMGFALPIDHWLRGALRDWAEDLLSESRLKEHGIFDPVPIRLKWKEHLDGNRNWQHHLWDVLMFQSWYNVQ